MNPTTTAPAGPSQFRYHAFISYSQAADGRLAPALQAGLQRLARPWYRLRAMRVFRDATGLAVTPELWGSIERALAGANYFILLASPAAAQSKWVEQEVDWWLDHRPASRLLIVWTDGELVWDDAARILTGPKPTRCRDACKEPSPSSLFTWICAGPGPTRICPCAAPASRMPSPASRRRCAAFRWTK